MCPVLYLAAVSIQETGTTAGQTRVSLGRKMHKKPSAMKVTAKYIMPKATVYWSHPQVESHWR